MNVPVFVMSFQTLASGQNKDTTMAASDAHRRMIVFDMCTNEVFSGLREVNLSLFKDYKLPDHPGWCDDFSVAFTLISRQFELCHSLSSRTDANVKSPEEDREGKREPSLMREVSDKMFCSTCKCPFSNREEQVGPQLHAPSGNVLFFFLSREYVKLIYFLIIRWNTTNLIGIASI